MRESIIEKAVCDYARKKGCVVIKNATPGHRGIPDRLFLKDGRALFLEFKAPGEKPTALQERWLRQLRERGFHADWCDDVDNGKIIVDAML